MLPCFHFSRLPRPHAQNSLLQIALEKLDAPTYQCTYQAKTLTTAMLSIPLLGRKFDTKQW